MNTTFFTPITLSIQVALISGMIVAIIGTFVGLIMARKSFRGKIILETLFLLPMVLPPTVVGFFLLVIFGKNSVIGQAIEAIFKQPIIFTFSAAVLSSVVVSFPLMYQAAKTGFLTVHRDIEDAARINGCNEWHVFWRITLPLIAPSLVTGIILSISRSLGEFGATLMFAGNIPGKTQTLPTAIYMAIDSNDMNLAWKLVGSTMLLSITLLGLIQFLNKKNGNTMP